MQYYNFQSDLTKAYPILSETKLILADDIEPNMVQDTILSLLPGAFSILGTKVRLILITVMVYNHVAYWDLIFEYPKDYDNLDILNKIFDNTIELDDSFDHNQCGSEGIHKISFKVG